ncbi:MAG: hypothetical protein ACXVIN_07460 [Halobacteriota archaeon]
MLTKELCAFGKLEKSNQAAALKMQKLVVDLLPWQDRLECNITVLCTQVVEAVAPALDGRRDDERTFEQLSFREWLKHTDIPLLNGGSRIVNEDLRRFCEHESDLLQWDESNKNYILAHGVRALTDNLRESEAGTGL